jgi:fructose-specific component phosphotransferase system IIB-like protein
VEGPRKIAILLLLAAAVPATAQTFGFSLRLPARNVCLSIGDVTYRLSTFGADYTVRIDPDAPAPDVRVHLAAAPDDADFVLVDDGTPPGCHAFTGSASKTVQVSASATAPDLTVGLATAAAADYRIYVRSERLSPETAAALFAVARRPPGHAVARR